MTLIKCPSCGYEHEVRVGRLEIPRDSGQLTLEMSSWQPGEKRELEEKVLPWHQAGWKLGKTGPKMLYILKMNGEDFLHFHVDTEAKITTPRNILRKYQIS